MDLGQQLWAQRDSPPRSRGINNKWLREPQLISTKCGVWLGPGLTFAETLLLRLRRKGGIQRGATVLMRRPLETAF